jgi:hypothetical protein
VEEVKKSDQLVCKLYKCSSFGVMVFSFDTKDHVMEKHGGLVVDWKTIII